MFVKILRESGYEEATFGLFLSFYDRKTLLLDWDYIDSKSDIWIDNARKLDICGWPSFWTIERFEKAKKLALSLATKQVPEDKEM